jgi:hypothetical protein
MLMSSLDTSIANAGMPTLAHAFTATFQDVQWIILAYLLAITTLIVSVGRLGDIVGRRRLLLIGISLFTIASALCGIAPTLWLLIAARAGQGIGAAIMMALTVALIGETVPKSKTGSAMGLLGTMSAIGTTLGPSLGGILIAGFGWRTIFLVNVPIGALNLILACRHLPPDRPGLKTEWTRFDGRGTLIFALALASYALAMTLARRDGHPERVVDQGEHEVLLHIGDGRLRKLACPGDAAQVAFNEGEVPTFHRHIGAGPHGDADVGAGECRGVVDPVAGHRDTPSLSLEGGDEFHLVLRADLAVDLVDPKLLGDCLRGGQTVTRGHNDPDARVMELADRLGRRVLDRVRCGNLARGTAVQGHEHDRCALCAACIRRE